MKRFIFCGGRDFDNVGAVVEAVSSLISKYNRITVIYGGASGADALAASAARVADLPSWRFPAQWAKHGRSAGPIRNAEMLEIADPDGVVAFPGGKGTADMVKQARAAGVTVWEPLGTP